MFLVSTQLHLDSVVENANNNNDYINKDEEDFFADCVTTTASSDNNQLNSTKNNNYAAIVPEAKVRIFTELCIEKFLSQIDRL